VAVGGFVFVFYLLRRHGLWGTQYT
jgi:hypothetical protein